MTETLWHTGLNDFKKHTLITDKDRNFTTELIENDFEPDRDIDSIFFDHLKDRPSKTVELLYSGGLDSELVLASCLRNKIPVEAMTLVVTIRGAILNVVDLYYSEKFCREHNVKQNLFYLDVEEFYKDGKHFEYLSPYYITEPHVATHFWLLDQCQSYPVIGGDWPWVQCHKENKVLSPIRIDFAHYENYMATKGISGIGNMINHSFESCYYFVKKHIENYQEGTDDFYTSAYLKYKMYGLKEPRIKSYGWELTPQNLINTPRLRVDLLMQYGGKNTHTIKWGPKLSELLETNVSENSGFV